jgi:transposase-like protein
MPTPTKFTTETRQTILEALTVGATQEIAAAVAGVSKGTMSKWMTKGREQTAGSFHDFVMEVEEAEAHPKMRALGIVYREMENRPDLAWKYIERRVSGFAPPVAQPAAVAQPVVIELSFHDGSAIAESYIEGRAVEQDETAATVLELPAAGSTPPGQAS